MFHTVLLETGNWSDAGPPHRTAASPSPTASPSKGITSIFSTSGQWLWDELTVVVPAGQDPYPIVNDITKQVAEATAEEARVKPSKSGSAPFPPRRGKTFSGTPGGQRQAGRRRSGDRRFATSPEPTIAFSCGPLCIRAGRCTFLGQKGGQGSPARPQACRLSGIRQIGCVRNCKCGRLSWTDDPGNL